MISSAQNTPAPGDQKKDCRECIDVLKNAMQSAETIFIKVHAAEALIFNNYYTGISTCFNKLVKEEPNLIVASRVLARVYRNDKVKYQLHVNTLLYQLGHADSTRGKLIALESLAKIGFKKTLPEIIQYADTGTHGFKAMACWVLANSGKPEDEDRLAHLLTSGDPTEFRGAAYALRFNKKIRPETLKLLTACAERVKEDDPARVYVISSLYVHAATATLEQDAKDKLLTYLKGNVGERYEVAEAFSMKGGLKDIPILNKLITDENMDVRVAAAKALWSIKRKLP
jgi:hypothetical protein